MADESAPTAEETTETPEAEEQETAEAASATEQAEDKEEGEEPAEGAPAEADTDLSKKYSGDWKKADQGYWHAVRRASRVEDENRVLRERLAQIQSTPRTEAKEAKEQPPPESADLKRIDSRLGQFTSRLEELRGEYNQGLLDLNSADKSIARLEAKIEDALDEQKPALEAKLDAAKGQRLQVIRDIKGVKQSHEELGYRIERLEAEKRIAQQAAEAEVSKTRASEKERLEVYESFPAEVDGIFDDVCQELGVPKELTQDFWEVVNQDLMTKLWAAGAQGNTIGDVDVEGIVRKRVERLLALKDGGRSAFVKKSKEQLATAEAAGTKPVAGGARAAQGKPKKDQLAMARKRLREMGL